MPAMNCRRVLKNKNQSIILNSKEKLTKNRMLITIIHDLDTTEVQLIFQLKIKIQFVRNLMFAFECCVFNTYSRIEYGTWKQTGAENQIPHIYILFQTPLSCILVECAKK